MLGVAAAAAPASASTGHQPSWPYATIKGKTITLNDGNRKVTVKNPYGDKGAGEVTPVQLPSLPGVAACSLDLASFYIPVLRATKWVKLGSLLVDRVGKVLMYEGEYNDAATNKPLLLMIWDELPTSCVDFVLKDRNVYFADTRSPFTATGLSSFANK
jgi:hypothetical protein